MKTFNKKSFAQSSAHVQIYAHAQCEFFIGRVHTFIPTTIIFNRKAQNFQILFRWKFIVWLHEGN